MVDQIYEAALVPSQWAQVLAALSQRFETKGALLFANRADDFRWLGTGPVEDIMEEFFARGWVSRNDRMTRLAARNHMGFLTGTDLFNEHELETLPIYAEFLGPRGVAAGAATIIAGAAGDDLAISLEGFKDHDAANDARPALDTLRPHLARAAMIASRVGLEKLQATVSGLQSIGVAAAVVASNAEIRAANTLFNAEIETGVLASAGYLAPAHERAADQFDTALRRVLAGRGGASVAVSGREGSPARVLHVLPIVGQAQDLFLGGSALVVITGRGPNAAPGNRLLEQLFDLTPAEARVARLIAQGRTLDEIADDSGASIHTVRTQAKSVLSKTGASRQTELALLLAGLSLPPQGVRFNLEGP